MEHDTGRQRVTVSDFKFYSYSCLTADGVVPLNLGCPSSREALLGPAGAAYTRSGIVVATDGSLKKSGAMGAAVVAKNGPMQAHSVTVFGQPSSIRPELTGIALALEGCPAEEDLNILTDSLSSMRLVALPSPREAAAASCGRTN
jgi:hypothetical protein